MRRIALLWLSVFLTLGVSGQNSLINDTLTLHSVILNRTVHYSVYLPPGYTVSQRTYPIIYLLHGAGDNHTAWAQKGDIRSLADRLTASGLTDSFILIMPDAGMSYYMNSVDERTPYEDFFFLEFMPYVELTYRITAGKRYRSVAGFSMGGYGALLYALHRPDLFQSSVALSAGIRTNEQLNQMSQSDYEARYRVAMVATDPEAPRVTEYYKERYSILHLVSEIPESQKKAVRFYIDCGDDDYLYKGNSLLHILMRDRNILHEYRVRNGGHNWHYWKEGIEAGLLFIQAGIR